jgi:homoserine kinase
MSFRVVVPASSANMGPGFDSLAVALSRYMTISVDPAGEGESGNAQQSQLTDGRDMVLYAMQYLADSVGRKLPPATIRSRSDIPVARGMGSSAAALIGGMVAGNLLLGEPLGQKELLKLASHVEGHADNLAAALFGGAVLAVPVSSGHVTVQLEINLDLSAAVLIPKQIGFTTDARAVVPRQVERNDAVFNASRCALLVHALAKGCPDLIGNAMQDRWHQPYRSALYPHMDDVIDAALRAGAYGASLSGSGPTILALCHPRNSAAVAAKMKDAALRRDVDCTADVLAIDTAGAQVLGTVPSV